MAEAATEPVASTAPALVLSFLAAIFRAIYSIPWAWLFSWLLYVVILPLKLVWIPLAFVSNVLLLVFAPLLHVVSYVASWVAAVVDFFASLEPLYIFFGAAAAVGIISGIIVGVSSSVITSYLGMQGKDQVAARPSKQRYSDDFSERRYSSSATDYDWQLLEAPSQRRRPAAGLLSQTIHEEDDDSEY